MAASRSKHLSLDAQSRQQQPPGPSPRQRNIDKSSSEQSSGRGLPSPSRPLRKQLPSPQADSPPAPENRRVSSSRLSTDLSQVPLLEPERPLPEMPEMPPSPVPQDEDGVYLEPNQLPDRDQHEEEGEYPPPTKPLRSQSEHHHRPKPIRPPAPKLCQPSQQGRPPQQDQPPPRELQSSKSLPRDERPPPPSLISPGSSNSNAAAGDVRKPIKKKKSKLAGLF